MPTNGRTGYGGYGVRQAGSGGACPPDPLQALRDCVEAGREVLAGTLQVHELAPWTEPGYRAKPVGKHARAIISTTVAFDAVTNAAGLALQAALSSIVTVPLYEMANATDWQQIFSYQANQSQIAVFKTWGISVENHAPEAAQVRVDRGGSSGGPPDPPNPFLSGDAYPEHQPTHMILNGGQTLGISVINLDTTTPLLVQFGITGWEQPVTKRIDGKEGTRLKTGYGLDCRR